MANYRIDSIARLARELAFAPAETSSFQVSSAEDLLHEIDATRAYPLDYVVFRITGYHPRVVAADLLTGIALQHDLGLLIEQLSDRLQLVAVSAGEPVLSIDDVTEQFNITSKTVQRWRRRGLPARRFLFGDGRRRVGFLLSSVERFIRSHREQVVDANPNLSRVGISECQRMIATARRLAVDGRCWQEEIARRIGKRTSRSPLTVLHTIRAFDQAHPDEAVFVLAAKPIGPKTRLRILREYRRGWTLKRLALITGRPRTAIYRVIIDERIARISRRKTRFIDDELFHQPDAEHRIREMVDIAGDVLHRGEESITDRHTDGRARDRDLPGAVQSLCREPLLTPARERALFLQLNLHKFRFVQARRKLDPQFAQWRQLRTMERHLTRAADVRNRIVSANLRLVVSVARKHLRPARSTVSSLSLMELVSDGSLTLMRAVDGFDIQRGNRFSTYATLSLMKAFAQARSLPAANLPNLHGRLDELAMRSVHPSPVVGIQDDVAIYLDRLTSAERRVIDGSFGLRSGVPDTAQKLASSLGVSPARVRQIEKAALAKMRGEGE